MTFVDQLYNTIELNVMPRRIVSLVPSQTELLYDLALEEEVVGITKFCIKPQSWFNSKNRVGGTKTVDVEKVKLLRPDLIIANKEENVKEQVDQLKNVAPVWVSNINDLEQALVMIKTVSEMVGRTSEAKHLINTIQSQFAAIGKQEIIRAAYIIWKDPFIAVGGDTFISSMMEQAGFENVFADLERYPEVSIEDLATCKADVLLLSSEPYPFKQSHVEQLETMLKNILAKPPKLWLVDGEMFSWYGSRLQYAPAYFQKLREEPASNSTSL